MAEECQASIDRLAICERCVFLLLLLHLLLLNIFAVLPLILPLCRSKPFRPRLLVFSGAITTSSYNFFSSFFSASTSVVFSVVSFTCSACVAVH